MSVKIMSMIFEAQIPDIEYVKDGEKRKAKASTAKLLLLAIADHANDFGEASYPGYSRLERKTCLSRQGIADTVEALRQAGYISVDDKRSSYATNSYTVKLSMLVKPLDQSQRVKPLDQQESSHLTQGSQATGLKTSLNHQINHPDARSILQATKAANKTIDGMIEAERKAAGKTHTQLPEVMQPYAEAFTAATKIKMTKREATDWLQTIQDWLDAGYQPHDVTRACQTILHDGRTAISRPGSITWKLRSQEAYKPQEEGHVLW